MRIYNKPELNVEAVDVEDIITLSAEADFGDGELQSAGMEFDITAEGNEF